MAGRQLELAAGHRPERQRDQSQLLFGPDTVSPAANRAPRATPAADPRASACVRPEATRVVCCRRPQHHAGLIRLEQPPFRGPSEGSRATLRPGLRQERRHDRTSRPGEPPPLLRVPVPRLGTPLNRPHLTRHARSRPRVSNFLSMYDALAPLSLAAPPCAARCRGLMAAGARWTHGAGWTRERGERLHRFVASAGRCFFGTHVTACQAARDIRLDAPRALHAALVCPDPLRPAVWCAGLAVRCDQHANGIGQASGQTDGMGDAQRMGTAGTRAFGRDPGNASSAGPNSSVGRCYRSHDRSHNEYRTHSSGVQSQRGRRSARRDHLSYRQQPAHEQQHQGWRSWDPPGHHECETARHGRGIPSTERAGPKDRALPSATTAAAATLE